MRKSVHRDRAARWDLHGASGQRKYLNADERRRFLAAAAAAPPKVRTLCLTLLHAGCRLSEALAVRTEDLESFGLIAIRSLKKRGRIMVRYVPVPPDLIQELAVVHGAENVRLWPWGRTRAWQLVKGVMAEARIEHLAACPKGLRHGFGVHAVLSGVPVTLIQRWLGHADIATTAIYTDVLGPEEQAIASRMWRSSDCLPQGGGR